MDATITRVMVRYAILGENGRDTGGLSNRFSKARKAVKIAFDKKLDLLWNSTCPYCMNKFRKASLLRHLTGKEGECASMFREDMKRAKEIYNILATPTTGTKDSRKRNEKQITKITLRIDRHLLERLDAYARSKGISRAKALRMAIRNLIENGVAGDVR